MQVKKILGRINNSSIGYLPIKIMEGILGILMLRIYTNLFLTSTLGDYYTYNPIILILFSLTIGWLNHASVRYVKHYLTQEEEKKRFFSSLFISWTVILVALTFVFLVVYFLNPNILNGQGLPLAIVLIASLVGYSMNQILIILLLYMDKRGISNGLMILAPTLKIILTVVLFNQLQQNILAIFISQAVTDICLGLFAMGAIRAFSLIRLRYFSVKLIKMFLLYGYPLIGLGLVMSILNVSDRFIIRAYFGKAQVGIYTANYSIASAIFAMLMIGLVRSMYPKLLKAYADKDLKTAELHLARGIRNYFLVCLPAATGLLLLSDPISKIFINEKYTEGHLVIGIVAFGYLFLGLTEYVNKGWELTGKTWNILIQCSVATLLNIILNLIFIPRFGYIVSAYSTLFAFIVYFVISYLRRAKGISLQVSRISTLRIVFSNTMMAIFVLLLKKMIETTIMGLAILVVFAIISYFVSLYLSGEIKDEVKSLREKG